MTNIEKLYDEFAHLAGQVGEPAELKAVDSTSEGDIEITFKFTPRQGVKDGDWVVFFKYDTNTGKADSRYYIAKICIPSGNTVSKKRFTTKRFHVYSKMILKFNRFSEFKDHTPILGSSSKSILIDTREDHSVFVVRKMTSEEIEDMTKIRLL